MARFVTITAKFAGSKCKRCGEVINVGDKMRYAGRGQTWHLKADCPSGIESDAAAGETDYKARAAGDDSYGSNYTRFASGAEVYTNKHGRCEDAPCCGCCT